MKRIMHIIIFNFFIFISFFCSISLVEANTIHSIDMDIYIDDDGNAKVTEVWKTTMNKGTEGFKTYTNLEYSNISKFRVIDENKKEYENIAKWETNASFYSKSYKSGINHIKDGIELCWGISEYGEKTYTLKYEISNFVYQYTDTQGIYFNLINLDQTAKNAKIKIYSDVDFSLDNSRIWAFGYNGDIIFKDGSIILKSKGSLSKKEYMVGLIRFEYNIFDIDFNVDKSFDEDYENAMLGIEKKDSDFSFVAVLIFVFIFCLPFVIRYFGLNLIKYLISIIGYLLKKNGKIFVSKKVNDVLDFGPYGTNLPWEYEINYWREIPCDKDIFKAYWISYYYNIVPVDTLHEGLIGAILLKWIKEGHIIVIKDDNSLLDFKDNNYKIDLSHTQKITNNLEIQLLKIFKKASGLNGILESKELIRWCEKNYDELEKWFYLVLKEEQKKLEELGIITEVIEKYGNNKTKIKRVLDELRDEAIKLSGLKKFLIAFSIMQEREYIEVHIWEDYLIFAEIFGIADKVAEQFSKLYPDFIEASKYNLITRTIVRNIASSSRQGIERGRKKSENRSEYLTNKIKDYSGTSRNSGGGGKSYSSGGSSARGSSGGGFR